MKPLARISFDADERMVLIEHVNPPIPIRWFDYKAQFADAPDGPTGWGKTPKAAMADLREENA